MKILDIGSNNGNFIKTYCNSDDYVVAIEANPQLKNPFVEKNILWKNIAVSNKSGEKLNFYLAVADTVSSLNLNWLTSGRFNGYFSNNYVEVDTTTIDNIIEEYGIFDHIKLDVEGYEDKAIYGMTKNYNSSIQFEWANEWFHPVSLPVLNHLKNLNYTKFNVSYDGCRDYNPKMLPETFLTYEELIYIIENQRTLNSDAWGMILARV
jgi:FkbM family methyltransferase